ncbi:MAG: hypothetical protein LC730_04290 [Acidobacteria bacterium]|nr:hypothetical protein [Acidobacteriota bacterium]MCA1608664.1 hypothetical protein [Acidobacteriota bacterium]
MATHINQIESEGLTLLRVTGEMRLDDAKLLEKIAGDIATDSGKKISIDLADLSFLDSDSAPVLRRLASQPGTDIVGVEIFLQSAVDEVEKRESAP